MAVRFSQVAPGIFRGGKPSEEDLLILHDLWGIKRVISLDLDAGMEIAPEVEKLRMEQIIFPIHHETDLEKLDNAIPELFSVQPMYLHCVHGRDRTGLAVALFRIQQGWDPRSALHEAFTFNFGDGLLPDEKKHYIDFILGFGNSQWPGPDVVDKLRDTYDNPQPVDRLHSFSPSPPVEKQEKTDQQNADDDFLKDYNEAMAQVGVYENCNPVLKGIGPIEPCGVMPCGWSWTY